MSPMLKTSDSDHSSWKSDHFQRARPGSCRVLLHHMCTTLKVSRIPLLVTTASADLAVRLLGRYRVCRDGKYRYPVNTLDLASSRENNPDYKDTE